MLEATRASQPGFFHKPGIISTYVSSEPFLPRSLGYHRPFPILDSSPSPPIIPSLSILFHPGYPLASSCLSATLVASYSEETLSPSTCFEHKHSTRQRGERTVTMEFSCYAGSSGLRQWINDEEWLLKVLCWPPIPPKDVFT